MDYSVVRNWIAFDLKPSHAEGFSVVDKIGDLTVDAILVAVPHPIRAKAIYIKHFRRSTPVALAIGFAPPPRRL